MTDRPKLTLVKNAPRRTKPPHQIDLRLCCRDALRGSCYEEGQGHLQFSPVSLWAPRRLPFARVFTSWARDEDLVFLDGKPHERGGPPPCTFDFDPADLWHFDLRHLSGGISLVCHKISGEISERQYQPIAASLEIVREVLQLARPVVFGITRTNGACRGDEAVIITGYDDAKEVFIVRWSLGGMTNYHLPYSFLAGSGVELWAVLRGRGA